MSIQILPNYIGKQWVHPTTVNQVDVVNPATTEVISRIQLSSESDVDRAVQSAAQAFQSWRETPATDRIQYLFSLKQLLEEHLDQIARPELESASTVLGVLLHICVRLFQFLALNPSHTPPVRHPFHSWGSHNCTRSKICFARLRILCIASSLQLCTTGAS